MLANWFGGMHRFALFFRSAILVMIFNPLSVSGFSCSVMPSKSWMRSRVWSCRSCSTSLLLLEEVDEVADVPLWDCASVTVICSAVGALGAETGVDFGRAPVWWKADGGFVVLC